MGPPNPRSQLVPTSPHLEGVVALCLPSHGGHKAQTWLDEIGELHLGQHGSLPYSLLTYGGLPGRLLDSEPAEFAEMQCEHDEFVAS